MSGLEIKGYLIRERRRSGGHQAASRLQLLRNSGALHKPHGSATKQPKNVWAGAAEALAGVDPVETNEGLRAALIGARDHGWGSEHGRVVIASLIHMAPRQFAAIHKRRIAIEDFEERKLDTLSAAWEVVNAQADTLIAARKPWAMLTTIVARQTAQTDEENSVQETDSTDPHVFPEQGIRPGEGIDEEVTIGIDDFDQNLSRLVEALIAAGMSETLAWAGTGRIASLAVVEKSRRHTVAARDYKLEALGGTPEAARMWMNVLAGSRRGAQSGIITTTDDELAQIAQEIVIELSQAA
ncbi:hypothetical protein V5R04_01495 [Jonesiaceae bacterium BS-20]|uniref:Uncharacterized protein n=1 Tax=Jonesiaceae bacterium BS-20 TaxID=3120821 RepID=A0AAU7DW38_9MICO